MEYVTATTTAVGVVDKVLDTALVPEVLVALTVQLWLVPPVKPVTTSGLLLPDVVLDAEVEEQVAV